jgi:hypothetical protein
MRRGFPSTRTDAPSRYRLRGAQRRCGGARNRTAANGASLDASAVGLLRGMTTNLLLALPSGLFIAAALRTISGAGGINGWRLRQRRLIKLRAARARGLCAGDG